MKKHDRQKLTPLTEEQRIFCENNHNLVYSFLHKHGYNIEDYYSIAVVGYIKACQIYLTREDLQEKYDFAFIAHMNMKSEIGNQLRIEQSYFRQTNNDTMSIDVDTESYYNVLKDGQNIELEFLENEFVKNVLSALTSVQSEILILKMNGYSRKEILDKVNLDIPEYRKQIRLIKPIVTEMQSL